MEFDEVIRVLFDLFFFDVIREEFKKYGYELLMLVFWNVFLW